MPLKKAGDLIPVVSEFKSISSGARRRAQFMNFIHRGLVTYSTLVYDRNIGDVMALVNYFHPEFFTEQELNDRFGLFPNSDGKHDLLKKDGDDSMVPRILIFPEDTHNDNQTPVRTISQKIKCIVFIFNLRFRDHRVGNLTDLQSGDHLLFPGIPLAPW